MTTATVLDIDIVFAFTNGNGDREEHSESFTATDSSLQTTIDDRFDELVDEMNDDSDDEWEKDGYTIDGFDDDWKDPADFDDLDEYGEYAENVENHGVAYHLRYDDIGDHDFDDSYNGEWDSAEDFVESFYGDCYEIPDHLASYIDWEKLTRDIMMDYSEYEDSSGQVHIFRD